MSVQHSKPWSLQSPETKAELWGLGESLPVNPGSRQKSLAKSTGKTLPTRGCALGLTIVPISDSLIGREM